MRIQKIDNLNDKIYYKKTAEYFREVISSFYSQNYRSAIVMLYSVVICDLIHKLQELKDVYDDKGAESILTEIEKKRKGSPRSSEWENVLIEKVYNEIKLFETADYENINHLKKHRNLCAHPTILENYLLYTPNKETTQAHIINLLDSVLTKPALLTKKSFNQILNDVNVIKEIILNDSDRKKYLKSKYFDKMNKNTKFYIFKSLWKFVFQLSEKKHDDNRDIHYKIMAIIAEENIDDLISYIDDEKEYFSTHIDKKYIKYLLKMLNEIPKIYNVLTDAGKTLINSTVKNNANLTYMAVFLSKTIEEHYKIIDDCELSNTIDCDSILYLFAFFKDQGYSDKAYKLIIKEFLKSDSFDQADERFDSLIEHNIGAMNKELVVEIIKGCNENCQIYNRRRAEKDNRRIKEVMEVFYPNFDYSSYENFHF